MNKDNFVIRMLSYVCITLYVLINYTSIKTICYNGFCFVILSASDIILLIITIRSGIPKPYLNKYCTIC